MFPDFALTNGGPGFDGFAAAGSLLRLVAAVLAFVMALKALTGIFLVLTHGGSEERKAVAHKTLNGGAIGFMALLALAAVIPSATTKLSELASRYF